jgi:hypothetical protein
MYQALRKIIYITTSNQLHLTRNKDIKFTSNQLYIHTHKHQGHLTTLQPTVSI